MWVLQGAHRLSRSFFFGGEEDPADPASAGVQDQEVQEQPPDREHDEQHDVQHDVLQEQAEGAEGPSTGQGPAEGRAVHGMQREPVGEHTGEHVAQQEQVQEAVRAQLDQVQELAGEPDREDRAAGQLDQGQVQDEDMLLEEDHLQQGPPEMSDAGGVEQEPSQATVHQSEEGKAASADSYVSEAPVVVEQDRPDAVSTGQAGQAGQVGDEAQLAATPSVEFPDVRGQVAHWPPRPPPPPPPSSVPGSGLAPNPTNRRVSETASAWSAVSLPPQASEPPRRGRSRSASGLPESCKPDRSGAQPPPPPPPSARPSVSAMGWLAAGSAEDADEAEQGTSTRYATDGSDDERATESDGGSESDGDGHDGGLEDTLDDEREDSLLPPRRAGVGTSRVSALRQVLLSQASPFALRAAMWRGPEAEPLLHHSAREGEGPLADADSRADKAVQIPVPTRERHPQLIEDLKAFLGEKAHSKQMEPEEQQSRLASPFSAKSPEERTVAEAMSSRDAGGQGLELQLLGLGGLGHGPASPTGDSSTTADECAQPTAITAAAIAGTSSLSNGLGQAEHRRPSACCTHGHGGGGPAGVEDKCLECCVYYGVMCCQCTIM